MMAIKLKYRFYQPYISATISCLLFFLQCSYAQQFSTALKVGEPMRNISLTGFLNQPGKKISFSSLKGKLVILDYWYTRCSACLEGMPEMDSLQQEFGNKIKIILVTKDKAADVNALFKHIKMYDKIKHLDVITDDKVLSELFPHEYFPYHTWIDPQGIYRYGTFFYNATRTKIREVLQGKQAEITQIKPPGSLDSEQPLIGQLKWTLIPNIVDYALVMKGLSPYSANGITTEKKDSLTQMSYYFKAINSNPLILLQNAFLKNLYGPDMAFYDIHADHRLIIEVKDPSKLYLPKDFDQREAWLKENDFSCEFLGKRGDDIYKTVQQKLNEVLPYRGVLENRKTTCFALVVIGNTDSLLTKGGAPQIRSVKGGIWRFRNRPMKSLIHHFVWLQSLIYKDSSYPVVDQTDFTNNIDVEITGAIKGDSADELNKQLKKYGLALVKRELIIPMLVIKDK